MSLPGSTYCRTKAAATAAVTGQRGSGLSWRRIRPRPVICSTKWNSSCRRRRIGCSSCSLIVPFSIYSVGNDRLAPTEVTHMALGLTPEHLELADAVRGWAQRHSPAETVRAAANSEDSGAGHYREHLAPALAAQGLFGLHLAEADGGQGFGLPELAVAAEELGRALLPGGYLPTVLASAVLAQTADAPGGMLAKLADGSLTATVSLAAALSASPGPDGGLVVSGETGPVLAGTLADVVIARAADALVVLDTADLTVSAEASL